jgi:hypothetical protein
MTKQEEQRIQELLDSESYREKLLSKLGFFSKTMAFQRDDGSGAILKIYKPVSPKLADRMVEEHNAYVRALRVVGVELPDTKMHLFPARKKWQPVIIQQPLYDPEEMVRYQMETAAEQEPFRQLLADLLDATFFYLQNRERPGLPIGFHPTLRNYARRNQQLIYFDTFPPMLMEQQQLNRIILDFAPVQFPIGKWIPTQWINLVSNEYYDPVKMITGIVGSACRLRPEWAEDTMNFAIEHIQSSTLSKELITNSIQKLQEPPRLRGIWVFVRKLLGKEGKPNLN